MRVSGDWRPSQIQREELRQQSGEVRRRGPEWILGEMTQVVGVQGLESARGKGGRQEVNRGSDIE